MRDKLMFAIVVIFNAMSFPLTAGFAAIALGTSLELSRTSVMATCGGAIAFTFGAVLALARFVAGLLFDKNFDVDDQAGK